jgi:LSD1 subclass zinc finger protein
MMQTNQCFQCDAELMFKVGGEQVKCLSCGAINEAKTQGLTIERKSKSKNNKKSSDDGAVVAAVVSLL